MGIFGKSRGPGTPPQMTPPFNPNAEERDPIWGELAPELTAPMPKKRGLFGNIGKVLGTAAEVLTYGPYMGMVREARAANAAERDVNRRYKEYLIEQGAPETFEDVMGADGQIIGQRNTRTREYKQLRDQDDETSTFIREGRALGLTDEQIAELFRQRYSRPEGVVQVAGPGGPIYTTKSDAIGRPAYVKPPAPRAGAIPTYTDDLDY